MVVFAIRAESGHVDLVGACLLAVLFLRHLEVVSVW